MIDIVNFAQFQKRLIADLTPLYGESEANAIARTLEDYLIRKAGAPVDKNKSWPPETEEQATQIQEKLLRGTPLQYALKESWFDGRCFYVDPSVLIPRPETEELLDWIRKDHSNPSAIEQVLDIGTGSGILAISLKRYFPAASVIGIDVSEPALKVAQKNASELTESVLFQQLDFSDRSVWIRLPKADIIVSNPPYIGLEEQESIPMHVRAHEPYIALFVTNGDPLQFYRLLAEFANDNLCANGNLFVEMHAHRARETQELFESFGYQTEIRKDMQGMERMLKAIKRVD